MRVLLCGGAGYIGTHVALEFLERGDTVGIFDNLSSGLRGDMHPDAIFHEGPSWSDLTSTVRSPKVWVWSSILRHSRQGGIYAQSGEVCPQQYQRILEPHRRMRPTTV
jgi:NAD(P)-dependent dehydrogenase (short-subunit alcohol dehydrogenase family)